MKFKISKSAGYDFAKKSGDYNKIHIDEIYGYNSMYGEMICHGCNIFKIAAEKIVKVWSDLSKENVSKSQNWFAFKWLLKLIKLRKMPSMILKSLSPNKQGSLKENQKFPPLNKNHIQERLTKLHKILGIEGIKCEFLSDRTILIKRD